jgi:hypothetical protein
VLLAAGLPMRFRNLQGVPPDSPGLPRNLQPFTAAGPEPHRLPTPSDHTATTAPKRRVPV